MFTLKIRLGNAAMQTPEDVATALQELAPKMEMCDATGDYGRIMDHNGNHVGDWTYKPSKFLLAQRRERDDT